MRLRQSNDQARDHVLRANEEQRTHVERRRHHRLSSDDDVEQKAQDNQQMTTSAQSVVVIRADYDTALRALVFISFRSR